MRKKRLYSWLLILLIVFSSMNLISFAMESSDDCSHTFGEWIVIQNADCETDGTMYRECDQCNSKESSVIPATGHTYKVSSTTKASSEKNGKIVKKCKTCNHTTTVTIAKPKTIKFSTSSYTYNGSSRKPSVKLYDSNGNLISSSNYTVTYAKGRKNVGKYKVTVTFKSSSSKYKGSLSSYFTIKPKSTAISSLTKDSKAFTVKWKKCTTQTSGYEIRYSTSSSMTDAKKKLVSGTSTTSKKITGLKAGTKYYVQVRTYKTVNGTKYYSSWCTKKSVTTKGSSNTTSSSANRGNTVYVTETGSKYHYNPKCRGLSNANAIYKTTLLEAQNKGFTLCGFED